MASEPSIFELEEQAAAAGRAYARAVLRGADDWYVRETHQVLLEAVEQLDRELRRLDDATELQ
jgi:hypothetical protein